MFYNKDNPQWKLSQDQYLSDEEYHALIDDYNELTRSMLSVDFRDINEKFYGVKEKYATEEERERKRRKTLFGTICAMIVFAGLILSLVLKQILIFAFVFTAIFLIAGISILITGRGEVVESTSKAIFNRVIGVAITLASVLVLLLLLFRSHFAQAEFFLLIFVIVFGIAGLTLLAVAVMPALSGKLIYTEQITATCAGYVRSVDAESGEHNNRFLFIKTSPLFNYSYEGIQYEAVYDDFVVKKDSDIALGQNALISIDPRHPENIKSPAMTHKGALALEIGMALICIAVAVGMGIYIVNGSAKDMTVETQWNPAINKINGETESSVIQVTDEMIQELYVDKLSYIDEWYVETCTVASTKITAEGEVMSFEDKTFQNILYPDCSAPEPGTKLTVFYYIDEEYLPYGEYYKRSFTSGDPALFEYVGSHGAYSG